MAISVDQIMKRAKAIFENERPGDDRWGTNVPGGQTAFRTQISEGRDMPKPSILTPAERQPYLDKAQQELEAEEKQKNQ